MSPLPATLPNLIYLGDVPVESSYHGSALLYRLLQNYPPERLRIIEGNLRNSLPERRLRGVTYRAVRVGWRRPLYTRFNRWATLAYSFAACRRVRAAQRASAGFQPDAVLSVTHDFLWLTAAEFARRFSLPLHLICHDDWPGTARVPERFRSWLDRRFLQAYRQARSRFCVCPYMAEEYQRRYRVPGMVLYPLRSTDSPCFEVPPQRLLGNERPLTVAFAGTINSSDYARVLRQLADCLASAGGRLLMYGPLDEAGAAASGLKHANIQLCGLIPSSELVKRLHVEADVLFVPMSFGAADREGSSLSFPSKLTDYTAAGLPLLIQGPDYCSAVRWAQTNPGVAELVTVDAPTALAVALDHLRDRSHREALAAAASRAGDQFFSHSTVEAAFLQALVPPEPYAVPTLQLSTLNRTS